MNKLICISSDGNPDYYNLLPLTCYSIRKLGYDPFVFYTPDVPKFVMEACNLGDCGSVEVQPVPGVKNSTLMQLMRLFAWQWFSDDFIIVTGDADMVIAKDIFTQEGDIVTYGHDLTGFGEYPICYVKATATKWRELMGDYVIPEKAYSDKWEDYWSVDQQLLTQRIKAYGEGRINSIHRGNNNKHGLPTGRWDRHDWAHVPDNIIDVHMKRNDWDAQFQVFKRLWPEDDMQWLLDYKEKVTAPIETQIGIKHVTAEAADVMPRQDELNKLESEYPWFIEDVSNWNNHRPLLLLALSLTNGAVTELGSGDGSTQYLFDYCMRNGRTFKSFDYNKDWAIKTGSTWVENWESNYDWQQPVSVLFVDESPGEHRWISIRDMKDKADIIVVHDSEKAATGYMLDRVYNLFSYVLHYNHTGGGAGACILSNTIDVTVYKGLTLGAFKFDE